MPRSGWVTCRPAATERRTRHGPLRPPMEAKALTTQDLTSDLPTKPTTSSLDSVTLNVATDRGLIGAADFTPAPGLAAVPGAELVTSDQARADGPAFDEFGVSEPICAALAAAGITRAFPIQALTLPIALDKHDVIGQARTGTGKTLAFAVPILQHLLDTPHGKPRAPRALVVVPTRELAIQVADDMRTAAARTELKIVTLYGGRAYEPQIEAL